jgi:transcription antitermination factor NusG
MSAILAGETGVEAKPAAGAPPGMRWYVVHTRSRQEKALASDLLAKGVDYFLPLVTEMRYYGRRKFRVEVPLFSGYLFLKGTVEQTYMAERTDRVAKVIKVADQGALERELAMIGEALARGAPLRACDGLREGTMAEVTSGPFKGITGLIERGVSHNRLLLHVGLIGKAAVLEIERSLLRAI